MQSQSFPHTQSFHHHHQQQQPMQMHFVHHVPRPSQLSPTWSASSNPAVERMALPALHTALLPSLQMQRMTLQSPSVSVVVGATAPGQSPTKKRVRALPNASKSITLDLLRPHFEKPLAEVAAMFGICMTLMKKICRKNGVPRWPHRQIRGLRKSIWSIEKALRCCDSDAQRRSYNDHLHKQRAKLATILRGPDGLSRAAFDKILAEPLSPASDRASSPVSASATTESEASSALSNTLFSLERFSAIAATASPAISTGKISSPTVVKLPPIASLLRASASGEPSMQRTGYFSGTFQI